MGVLSGWRRAAMVAVACVAVSAAGARVARAFDAGGSIAIVLSDNVTGEIGVGVLGRGVASGNSVPWVQAGVGAIAILGDVNAEWGPRGLGWLREGASAQAVVDSILALDPHVERLQVGVLDRSGNPAGFTGPQVPSLCGGQLNIGVAAQANSLAKGVGLAALYDSSAATSEQPLAERLLKALRAATADSAGGPGLRSAALLVGRYHPKRPQDAARYVYLRVDDHAEPLHELERLYALDTSTRLAGVRLDYLAYFRGMGGNIGPARLRRERAALRAELDRALADDRLGAPEFNALAWALAPDPEYAADAARAVAKARTLAPKSAAVLDTAAEVAARAGRLDEALRLEREAVALEPHAEAWAERLRALERAMDKPAGK